MDADAILKDKAQVTHATGVVGKATMLSRILGAVRDILFASFFGAGMVSDAFIAAFRLPNMLRRMFGEGSLSLVFVPVFTDCLIHRGQGEARRMAASALRLLALILALVSVAGIFLAPWLVRLLAPGFVQWPEKFALTVQLAGIMMPYIFFVGLVALCMGILNVLGHFAAPALAPVFLNLAMITTMLITMVCVPEDTARSIWLAAGVLIGGGWQLMLQIPFLMRYKIHFWRGMGIWHPELKRVLVLLGPVLFSAAVYQINSVVITLLATTLPQGSVSYLYYADRLIQLPLGVFGFATATAVLPALSRQAAGRQWEALRHTFAHAISLIFFITLPAMVGLIVLRGAIVELLFQRGAFDAHATRLTADALLYYGIGLWSFAALRVVLNLFFALQDTRTPLKVAVLTVAANLVFGLALMGPMGHDGLALALALASMVQLMVLVSVLRRRMGAMGWRVMAFSIARSGLCAAIMGVAVWAGSLWLLPGANTGGIQLLAGVTACIVLGVVVFCSLAYAMGAPELKEVMAMVFQRSSKR